MSKITNAQRSFLEQANFVFIQDIPKLDLRILFWGLYRVDSWDYQNVNLSHWILYWNYTPGLCLTVNGQRLTLSREKIYLFPPYTRFSGISEGEFIQFYMHFTVGAPFDRVNNEMIVLPAHDIHERVCRLKKRLSPWRKSLILTEIAFSVLARLPKKAFQPRIKEKLDPRIKRVLEVINRRPGDHYSNLILGKLVGMSVNSFMRTFLACVDMTPKQYILRKRLETARLFLMNTSQTIEEIALQVGFKNRYHFSKAFKSYYLHPPIAYRKMILSAEKRS